MSTFSQADFDSFIFDNGVIGFFERPVILASGRSTQWYINWRSVAEDVFLLDRTSEYLLSYVNSLIASGQLSAMPDSFYGVPEGATKLGVVTQYKWAMRSAHFGVGSHALSMGRAAPKKHGVPKDRFFVGMPRGKTIVIEDVTTTGGSLLSAIDKLIDAGVSVVAAIGLSNRMERRDDGFSVEQAVAKKRSEGNSIPYFYMSSALELLPQACRRSKVSEAICQAIQLEFGEFGLGHLRLDPVEEAPEEIQTA